MAKVKAKKSEVVVETKKDIIKKQKELKRKNRRELSETEVEVKNFIILLVVVVAVIGLAYFLTNRMKNDNTQTNETVIQYSEITVGMILNRNEYKEYYVLACSGSGTNASKLYSLYRTYQNSSDVTKLYLLNLDSDINSKYFSTEKKSNLYVTDVEDIMFTTDTLLYIKDGKIVKAYDDFKTIENILK